MSASKKFKEDNPKTYQAVIDAFAEAFTWVNANPNKAAETYIRYTKSKLPEKTVQALLNDKGEMDFSMVPKHTMKYADFLNKIGDIPKTSGWKDYYWDNNYQFNGS